MLLYGDYHTHTDYSDAKCSIDQLVAAAKGIGLKEIAVTDHGLGKSTFNYPVMRFEGFLNQKKDIERLRESEKDIIIYHGVETNILGLDGQIDISLEQMALMDIVVCGYHRFAHPRSIKEAMSFYSFNSVFSMAFKPSKSIIERNTKAFVLAIKNHPIDILSHINNHAVVDAREVAKVCADYNTFLEINNRHIDEIEPVMEELIKEEHLQFIISSDSHKPQNVGNVPQCIELAKKYGIVDRVVNLDKKPLFTKHH